MSGTQVYVSTINAGKRSLSESVLDLVESGFKRIEISSGHAYDESAAAWLEQYHRDRPDVALMLHNFAPSSNDGLIINLSHRDPRERARVVDFLSERLRLSAKLGCDYYAFHAGFRVPYEFGRKSYPADEILDDEDAMSLFVRELRPLIEEAQALGIRLGVENHVVESGNEGNLILFDERGFDRLFESIESELLCLHLDVGHLKVSARTLSFDRDQLITRHASRIVGAHLSDNDGLRDTNHPFQADSWFVEAVRDLPNLEYACLETRTRGDAEVVGSMMRALESSR